MADPWDVCVTNYSYLFQPTLLKGKVAFVTGGGSGIGFTITEILMRHGCDVVIGSRNLAKVQEAAQRLQAGTGRRCLAVGMDVRKPTDVIAAVDEALRVYGRIDILVNNAAGNFLCPLSSMSYNAYRTVLEIDTIGTFNCSKTVYDKYMKGRGGVIVNISAVLHMKGTVLQAHAGSAKAAIDALTKHMAVEWGPEQIRVVGVAPGPVAETEGMRKLGGVTESAADLGRIPSIPLGRMGTKLEVAHCVLFVASDAAKFVTGHTVVSDGGCWMTEPNTMESRMAMFQDLKNKAKL